ncbi:hypothetical protein HK105_204253 [Polyrhizophydium stewartii]|uniref:Membrane insertase YidC/Oxa/ALB C-terminal domain-containing protein n=1 Tax=Polyrhizophydium stewartii TaxID=2732419 RepID=A0ABR4N9F6_9FUNG
MEAIHSTPIVITDTFEGTPWYLTIILTTVFLRSVATLPLAIQNRRRHRRLQAIAPLLSAWENTMGMRMRMNAQTGADLMSDTTLKKQFKEKASELYRIHRCHPFYTFLLPWVQVPLFITTSFAIRWLVAFPVPWLGTPPQIAPGMNVEGALWFDDLTVADPTLITPILVGCLHLVNIEINAALRPRVDKRPTKGQLAFRFFMRSVAVFMIPVAAHVPMAITLYWLTSAGYSLVQNTAFLVAEGRLPQLASAWRRISLAARTIMPLPRPASGAEASAAAASPLYAGLSAIAAQHPAASPDAATIPSPELDSFRLALAQELLSTLPEAGGKFADDSSRPGQPLKPAQTEVPDAAADPEASAQSAMTRS